MFKKFSTVALIAVFAVVFVFGLAGPNVAQAADSPSLGVASSFAVLAGTAVTNVPTSDITGNVGLSPAAGSKITGLTQAQVTGTIYTANAAGPAGSVVNPVALTTAKTDLSGAYDDLSAGDNADAHCRLNDAGNTNGILPSGTDLGTFGTTPGILPSGLYCTNGSFTLANGDGVDLTLTGDGPWVFRTGSELTISNGASVIVATGSVCDVWWGVGSSATLGTTTAFVGNILALTSISMATGATLDGRALASTGAVTLQSNTINNTCPGAGGALHATLRVIKDVENDDGDDQHADDFTLYVKSSGTDVAGSPALGVASPGRTYLLAAGTYVVSEDEDSAYNQSFSGACDSDGNVTLANGQTKTCTITNDDRKDTDKSAEHEKATPTPTLPAAGIGPEDQSGTPWNIIIPTEIFIALFSFYLARKKLTI